MNSMKVIAPIIFGKMHFQLIYENEFFHEIKYNGMTSFMEFMKRQSGGGSQGGLGTPRRSGLF